MGVEPCWKAIKKHQSTELTMPTSRARLVVVVVDVVFSFLLAKVGVIIIKSFLLRNKKTTTNDAELS